MSVLLDCVCAFCSERRRPEKNIHKMEKVSVLMSHMVLSGLVYFGLVAIGENPFASEVLPHYILIKSRSNAEAYLCNLGQVLGGRENFQEFQGMASRAAGDQACACIFDTRLSLLSSPHGAARGGAARRSAAWRCAVWRGAAQCGTAWRSAA